VDAARPHVHDLRLAVDGVRHDAGLRARERNRLVPEVVDRHRGERARDPLPDGLQHVELTRVRSRGHLVREVDQLVGRLPHRGEHGDDTIARLAGIDQPSRDRLQPLRPGHRRAAELHHYRSRPRSGLLAG
jgi:hypothetical protein